MERLKDPRSIWNTLCPLIGTLQHPHFQSALSFRPAYSFFPCKAVIPTAGHLWQPQLGNGHRPARPLAFHSLLLLGPSHPLHLVLGIPNDSFPRLPWLEDHLLSLGGWTELLGSCGRSFSSLDISVREWRFLGPLLLCDSQKGWGVLLLPAVTQMRTVHWSQYLLRPQRPDRIALVSSF